MLQTKPIKRFDKTTAIYNTCQTKHQTHVLIFKFRAYLFSYTRLFTKLNLFEILHLLQWKFPDLRYIQNNYTLTSGSGQFSIIMSHPLHSSWGHSNWKIYLISHDGCLHVNVRNISQHSWPQPIPMYVHTQYKLWHTSFTCILDFHYYKSNDLKLKFNTQTSTQ